MYSRSCGRSIKFVVRVMNIALDMLLISGTIGPKSNIDDADTLSVMIRTMLK